MRPSRRVPLLRGLVGGTVATFVALTSHVCGGGQLPGMLGIVIPWLLSFMVCTVLAGIRLSFTRLTLSVMLSQALFHTLFVLGAITPRGGFAPHVHGIGALGAVSSAGTETVLPDTAMWVAHAVAAALTVLALHRGERLVHGLVAIANAIVGWLRRMLPTAVRPAPVSVRPLWSAHPAPRRENPTLSTLRRRGPPPLFI